MAATDLQTNFLPTSYWLAGHVTSALNKSDSRNSALQREGGVERGRMRGEVGGSEVEGDDRSRWGGRANGGRELTHM